ncbi:hypothetical protein FKP32DRAFT_1602038 [Trametes sanguinea]|nr:hypothetical protein FKP32DRAFT_1602038 [Trametes sanguinea]
MSQINWSYWRGSMIGRCNIGITVTVAACALRARSCNCCDVEPAGLRRMLALAMHSDAAFSKSECLSKKQASESIPDSGCGTVLAVTIASCRHLKGGEALAVEYLSETTVPMELPTKSEPPSGS